MYAKATIKSMGGDMKKVPVKNLKEDSYFSDSVYLDGRFILLTPDTPVTKELISRLIKWGFREVGTDGESQKKAPPLLTEKKESLSDLVIEAGKEQENLKRVQEVYSQTVHFMHRIFTLVQEKKRLPKQAVVDTARSLLEMVRQNKRHILNLPRLFAEDDNYQVQHSVKSAILAIAIGEEFKLPPHKMVDLAIAALIHEVGMAQLPEDLYVSNRRLSPREIQQLTTHTLLGYKYLLDQGFSREIANPALEHHERIDGSGYPRHLRGDKISFFSRIISVACAYDARTEERPYKDQTGEHLSLVEMLKEQGTLWDGAIIKQLISLLSLYPLGSLVRLSTDDIGIVVGNNPINPRFPVVKPIFDSQGKPLEDQAKVQTSPHAAISVKGVLSAEEIKKYKEKLK